MWPRASIKIEQLKCFRAQRPNCVWHLVGSFVYREEEKKHHHEERRRRRRVNKQKIYRKFMCFVRILICNENVNSLRKMQTSSISIYSNHIYYRKSRTQNAHATPQHNAVMVWVCNGSSSRSTQNDMQQWRIKTQYTKKVSNEMNRVQRRRRKTLKQWFMRS